MLLVSVNNGISQVLTFVSGDTVINLLPVSSGRGMHKTLNRGKRLVRGGSSERTHLLAGADIQESGRYTSAQSSLQNSQEATVVKSPYHDDDAVSSGGESVFDRRCDAFVNKSTTSSMLNYVDFRSEASWQQENRANHSRSASLHAGDGSADELDREGGSLQTKEINARLVHVDVGEDVDKSNNIIVHHDDEGFHHLDLHDEDVQGTEFAESHSRGAEQIDALDSDFQCVSSEKVDVSGHSSIRHDTKEEDSEEELNVSDVSSVDVLKRIEDSTGEDTTDYVDAVSDIDPRNVTV